MSYDNTFLGYGAYYSEAKETRKATMSQLYREVYDAVISFMTNDVHANFGHMKLMIGQKAPTNIRAIGAANSFTLVVLVECTLSNSKVNPAILNTSKMNKLVNITLSSVDDYYDKGLLNL